MISSLNQAELQTYSEVCLGLIDSRLYNIFLCVYFSRGWGWKSLSCMGP